MADSSSSSFVIPMTFNISNFFNSPMDRSTYLAWHSQFEDVLDIHDFSSFIDPSAPIPSKTNPDSTPNPAYTKWLKINKLVLSWIKATVSPAVQTLLFPCKSASEAWVLLDKRLSPISVTQIRNIKDQLRSLKKDPSQSASDYLLHAKSLADSLASAGSPLSDSELIDSVLDGLTHQYKEFVNAVHLCSSTSFDDFYDLLLQEENLLKKMQPDASLHITALAASRSNASPHQFQGSKIRGRGRGKGRGYTPGRGSSPAPDSRPPLLPIPPSLLPYSACQICNKANHTARLCPQRGNFAYVAETLTADLSSTHISDPSEDTNWCLDSGATHHMTPSQTSLVDSHEYQGNDSILVGNGAHLPISHVGQQDETYAPDWH